MEYFYIYWLENHFLSILAVTHKPFRNFISFNCRMIIFTIVQFFFFLPYNNVLAIGICVSPHFEIPPPSLPTLFLQVVTQHWNVLHLEKCIQIQFLL